MRVASFMRTPSFICTHKGAAIGYDFEIEMRDRDGRQRMVLF
jgi:hypothetical protein